MTSAVSRSQSFSVPVPPAELTNGGFVATRLFVSRDAGANWRIASTHHPEIRQIAVEAQDDGDYWFAIRRLTAQGTSYPSQPLHPQLHVLVDGTPPQLEITARQPTSQNLLVSVDSFDLALLPGSLEIRVLSADPSAKWESVRVDPKNLVLERGRLKATVSVPLSSPFDLRIRAAIWDKVGHKTVAETNLHRQASIPRRLDLTANMPASAPKNMPANITASVPANIPVTRMLDHERREIEATAQTYVSPSAAGHILSSPRAGVFPASYERADEFPSHPPIQMTGAVIEQEVPEDIVAGQWTGQTDTPQISPLPQTAPLLQSEPQADAFPLATFAEPTELVEEQPLPEQPAATETGLGFMERLVARQPENVRLRKAFAELLTDQGDLHRAEFQWRWVLKLSPQNLEARRQLADCLSAQNRQIEANQILDQVPASP